MVRGRLDAGLEVETAEGTLRYVPTARGSHWYNLDTKRFVKRPFVWRYTYGINFVFHRAYYGSTIQGWSLDEDRLSNQQNALYEILLEYISDFVHSPPEQFWFGVDNIGDGTQEVLFTKEVEDRIDTYTVEVTDSRGSVILHDSGELGDA